jgi:glycosyltransferase involved in cell wall biosynthesis
MKLLVILPRFPYPIEKGDKLRAYHQIRLLSQTFEILLVTISHSKVKQADIDKVKPYCKSITIIRQRWVSFAVNLLKALFNGWPLQAGYYYSSHAQRRIDKLIENEKPDRLYCQLLRTAAYAQNFKGPKTLDYQDVFSKGIERRIPTAGILMKPLLKLEYQRLQRYEKKLFTQFDHKTIISLPDRDYIMHPEREKIVIVPNGVDRKYFSPGKSTITHELIFTGNMGYPPNVDCAEYLVNKVLPIIHRTHPNTRIMLAGASPHTKVKALASDKVTVTGWVDDIRTCYSSAIIFLAPMQIGTGLQNKLLEAMSMRLPCITSSLCNAALGAADGTDILVGDNPQQVANHAVTLLENPSLRLQIAENGFYFSRRNYSWESATEKLAELIRMS